MYPVAAPIDVAYRHATAPYPVGPHTHNAVEIYFTLTDLPDVLLNNTVSAVPAGTVLIIPAFCIHQLYHETGVRYERYILSINSEWIKSLLKKSGSAYSCLFESTEPILLLTDKKQKKELIRRFDELLSLSDRITPETMISFFQLYIYLCNAVPKHTSRTKSSLPVSSAQKKVNGLIAYLHDHVYENIGVSNVAEHFHMNSDYLSRLFKEHMHISLGKYIILLKISVAEKLLREGKSVTEVQEMLAFSSYAYFFKTFQKTTGISPSRYRKQFDN